MENNEINREKLIRNMTGFNAGRTSRQDRSQQEHYIVYRKQEKRDDMEYIPFTYPAFH